MWRRRRSIPAKKEKANTSVYMQRSLITPILFFALQASFFAQEKIDRYGPLPREIEAVHLEYLAGRLKNERGARAVIVINKPRVIRTGWFLRKIHGVRKFLASMGADNRRFDVYAGVEREHMLTRVWLVRPGDKPPVFGALSLDDLLKEKISKRTLFDTDCFDYCDLSPFIEEPVFPDGLDYYAAALKANPGSTARIILGSGEKYKTGKAQRKLVSLILGRLVKKHRIRRNRITIRFINSYSAGLYIIPKRLG